VDLVVVVEEETGAKSGECGREAVNSERGRADAARREREIAGLPCEIHMIRPEEKINK